MRRSSQLLGCVSALALVAGFAGVAFAYGTVSESTVVDLSPTVSMSHISTGRAARSTTSRSSSITSGRGPGRSTPTFSSSTRTRAPNWTARRT